MSCGCNNTLPIVGGKRRRQLGKRNRTRRLRGGMWPFTDSSKQSQNFGEKKPSLWSRMTSSNSNGSSWWNRITGSDTTQSSQSFGTSPPPLPAQTSSPSSFGTSTPPLPSPSSFGTSPPPVQSPSSFGAPPPPVPPTPSLGAPPSEHPQKYLTLDGGSRRRRKKSYKGKKLRCVYGNTNNKYKRHSRRKNRSNSSSRTRK